MLTYKLQGTHRSGVRCVENCGDAELTKFLALGGFKCCYTSEKACEGEKNKERREIRTKGLKHSG